MENIGRRSFLTGLGALIVAPSIVRVQSIMPVRNLYYDRIFCDYLIGTDQLAIRMDRATIELRAIPNHKILNTWDIRNKVPAEFINKFKSLKPNENQQLSLTYVLPHVASDHGTFI